MLDSQGRLIGGKALELQLDNFVIFAYAVHFNLTATGETGGGFLTVYPGGDQADGLEPELLGGRQTSPTAACRPLSSNISIFIYASKTTHVLLDLQGWTLPDFSFLMGNSPADAAKAGRRGRRPAERAARARCRSRNGKTK